MILNEKKNYKCQMFENKHGHIYFRCERKDGYVMWLNSCLVEEEDGDSEQHFEDMYQEYLVAVKYGV